MTQIHNLVSVKCISEKCHRKYGGSNPQHRVLYTISNPQRGVHSRSHLTPSVMSDSKVTLTRTQLLQRFEI